MWNKTWEFSHGNRKNVVLYVFLFLIANILDFFDPLIIGHILNIIQTEGITPESLPSLIFSLSLLLVITFGFWMFHGPARLIELRNAFLVRANYKKYLLDGTMALPSDWHTDHHSGDTIDKIEKGTDGLYRYSSQTFFIIESVVRLVGSYIALAYFNLPSSYIVFFVVVMTITILLKFDKIIVPQYIELFRKENKISAKIFDIISNITTVIILRTEKLVSKAIFKKIMDPYDLYLKNNRVNEIKWFIMSMLSTSMIFLVLLSYILITVKTNEVVLIGTVFILYEYVRRINSMFFHFAYLYGDIVMQKTAVMNAEEISIEFKEKKKVTSNKLPSNWKELRIESLNFSYHTDEGEDLHLDNISLKINRNERIALIGESGSGKTTFLKIIRELYTPNNLNLYLDNRLLKKGFNSISSSIALIPQDPEIFSTTIKENITLGVNYSLKYVLVYTNMARFTSVANRLPDGFNSSIVEKGVNLSGGEKQRLALSRGLLASEDKAIVLLDEPTSSVDLKNELSIYKNIFVKFKNKTIISSIHRLHLLPLFDNIYFFRNGKIIASGSFKHLLKSSQPFKKEWEKYQKAKSAQ